MVLLPFDLFSQIPQLLAGALDPLSGLLALLLIHLTGFIEPFAGTPDDRQGDLQIA